MATVPTVPSAHSVPVYIEDGARIAAILLVWGVFAAVFTYGVGAIGPPGSVFGTLGPHVGAVFVVTGLFNALVYSLYRAIDYWQQHP